MDELMQALYNHVLEHLLGPYYGQTEYEARCMSRDAIGRFLWEQLPPEQKALLEELQRAYDYAQMAELEAMFLASFDVCKALAITHAVS